MMLFWLGLSALFVVLPYWITRLGCDMLQIGLGNRRLRLIILCVVAWLTWDWFQLEPVFWYSRRLSPDGHANNQIIAFFAILFAARYLWLVARSRYGRLRRSGWGN